MDRKFVAALSTYGEQLERITELEQENERLLQATYGEQLERITELEQENERLLQENEQLHLTIDGIMKLLGG